MVDIEKIKWSLATGLGGGAILGAAALGLRVFGSSLGGAGGLLVGVPTTIALWKVINLLDKQGHKIHKVQRVGNRFRIHTIPKSPKFKVSKMVDKKKLRKMV